MFCLARVIVIGTRDYLKKGLKFAIVLIQRETISTLTNFNMLPKPNQTSMTQFLAVFRMGN